MRIAKPGRVIDLYHRTGLNCRTILSFPFHRQGIEDFFQRRFRWDGRVPGNDAMGHGRNKDLLYKIYGHIVQTPAKR